MTNIARQHGPTSVSVASDREAPGVVASPRSARNQKLFGLQMLRGLAAVAVVYSHLMERVILRGFVSPTAWWLNLGIGRFGVCVFFAISGFVMIHANEYRFGQPNYRKNVLAYLRHRMARIYPPYFVATIIAIIFIYITRHDPVNFINIIKSLMFIPYLNPQGFYQPVYGVGWTLNYEVFFYLILGLTLSLSMRVAVLSVCIMIVSLVAMGTLIGNKPDNYLHSAILWSYTRPIMGYFVSGVLARAVPLQAFELSIVRWPVLPIFLAGAAAYLSYETGSEQLTFAPVFIFLFIRISVLYISYGQMHKSMAVFFGFLGDTSYSIYLTHSFILGLVTIAISRITHDSTFGIIACLCVGMTASFALGAVVYRYVERPMVRQTSSWLSRFG